jgi:hypothetical protein
MYRYEKALGCVYSHISGVLHRFVGWAQKGYLSRRSSRMRIGTARVGLPSIGWRPLAYARNDVTLVAQRRLVCRFEAACGM